ncbi:cytochrome c [Amycolatopsis sp. NBRC 101858]|uniref:FxSxx-COOH system tetratricopeptide repeat protein n=1 Tax=Amycolatopsis sp. NBRC 101858 TaxID=3032200 RepID=UPI0024A0B7A8|nr:FxSxx-COOH system tetratricopeptide repeat protein [Amycolatopsis sp. NBRC 101858]GLY34811.1 cytochrome c [Amycolatopsis sp. NBRC 101858]
MPERPDPTAGDHDLTWTEFGDGLWLMAAIGGTADPASRPPESPKRPGTRTPEYPADRGEGPEPVPPDAREPPPDRETAGDGTHPDPPVADRPAFTEQTAGSGGLLTLDPERDRPDADLAGESAAPILPGAAELVRALRPFKRKVVSKSPADVELDVDRTAEEAAQTGIWLPVTRPQRGRWLDLTLVVDSTPSMALWTPTVNAFVRLAERLGAFRTVRVRLLETGKTGPSEGGAVLGPTLRGGTADAPARGAGELIGKAGRSVLLLITDGVSDAWHRDLISPMLARWGRSMPVAIVHLLPQRLWARGGMEIHQTVLTAPGPLRPNGTYDVRAADPLLNPAEAEEVTAGAVPVPVLELHDRWLGWWASLVTGVGGTAKKAPVVLARDEPRPADIDAEPAIERSAREKVKHFHSSASPSAFRLATLLAAVPVDVGVARMLQAELVPGSGPDHLAEVFTSGLLERARDGTPWDRAQWEFAGHVRQLLLRGARRSDTAHAVISASRRFGDRKPVLVRLQAALAAPDATPDPVLPAATPAEIALERDLMRALSGPYLSRADRLESRLAGIGQPEELAHSGVHGSRLGVGQPGYRPTTIPAVSETMSQELKPSGSSSEPVADVHPDTETGGNSSSAGDTPSTVRTRILREIADSTTRSERRSGDEAPPVWGTVPPKNPNFTGRRELLDQLGERLGAGTTAVLPAALHGMGGIGKTQMAVEYIYRHLQDYDIVWWIQATQSTQIRKSLTELAQHLRLPGADEAITAVPAVREALRLGRPYRRWLLVFDSAEDPEMVRPFFPVDGPGQILVTSRNPGWAGIARPLEVAVFQREESKNLLGMRRSGLVDADADLIADKLGDLPLAIEQAAAWLAETGMTAQEYLRLFDEKVTEILDTSAPSDYEVSVAAAWNVSFDELSSRSPAAHQLLQVCAFFAPEPISRSLFVGGRGISVASELDAALSDPMRLGRAIRDINRYGLAKIDHRSDTLLLHRLVQLVLRNRMSEQHRLEMRHGAHQLLANLDPRNPPSPQHWPRYQEILPHIYDAELTECTEPWVRQLVVNLFAFLYHWGDHQGALALAERAVNAWATDREQREARGEELIENPPLLELGASERLAFYYWVVGRYDKAAEVAKATLARYTEAVGADSEETLKAQLTYAVILKARGDFSEARRRNGEIYERASSLLGNDDPITLGAAHEFIVALLLTGEYTKARELAEETYSRRSQILGFDNDNTIGTQVLFVLARRELGHYPWARIEMERIAERAEQLYGGDSVGTLRRRYYQSVACRKDGDHDAALELSRDALRRFRMRYGNNHPNAMACALGHSIDLRHARKFTEAKNLGEEVFDLYRQNLGESHPHTLSAALDLGVTLRLSGDPANARVIDERSLEQFRDKLGEDHPHTIVCGIDVASDLFALDRVAEAAELDADLLDRSRRVLGDDHPTTLAVQLNRSLDLRAIGEAVEADVLFEDVVKRYRFVLGENHPGTESATRGVRADCDIDPMPL